MMRHAGGPRQVSSHQKLESEWATHGLREEPFDLLFSTSILKSLTLLRNKQRVPIIDEQLSLPRLRVSLAIRNLAVESWSADHICTLGGGGKIYWAQS